MKPFGQARVIEVIEVEVNTGLGTALDPVRRLFRYFDKDGTLVAERDTWAETESEGALDQVLRHLPIYVNGSRWRCLCQETGDSAPGFGADGWRKHLGLSIGHPARIDAE